MTVETLAVGLRGTRSYVQGSQILARTAELIAAEAAEPALLVSAKFTKITDRGVLVALDAADLPAALEIGRAQFAIGEARRVVRFFEVEGLEAPRIDDVPPSTSGLVTSGDGGGHADFAIDATFESYLAAVIECVKALHAARGRHVTDIWLTALVGGRFPLASGYPRVGVLQVTPKIERIVDGRLQTLSVVDTEANGDLPPPFQICFSCLIES